MGSRSDLFQRKPGVAALAKSLNRGLHYRLVDRRVTRTAGTEPAHADRSAGYQRSSTTVPSGSCTQTDWASPREPNRVTGPSSTDNAPESISCCQSTGSTTKQTVGLAAGGAGRQSMLGSLSTNRSTTQRAALGLLEMGELGPGGRSIRRRSVGLSRAQNAAQPTNPGRRASHGAGGAAGLRRLARNQPEPAHTPTTPGGTADVRTDHTRIVCRLPPSARLRHPPLAASDLTRCGRLPPVCVRADHRGDVGRTADGSGRRTPVRRRAPCSRIRTRYDQPHRPGPDRRRCHGGSRRWPHLRRSTTGRGASAVPDAGPLRDA